ncbi:hypothetical protein ACJ72_07638 [Emergomyces africanus]|uniref:Mitochondrial chaperone BCS1-like ATPase lid domain-containing protein n=1 Tax=Emergomyces africanus TaxID=1955775 RepID=A0A1B7NMM5_9EURO|nr:hypothetical protein ACJ72_07638 [Emergomyces africanus]
MEINLLVFIHSHQAHNINIFESLWAGRLFNSESFKSSRIPKSVAERRYSVARSLWPKFIYTTLDGDIKYSAIKRYQYGYAAPSTQTQTQTPTKHIPHTNNSPEEIDSFALDFASRIPAGVYTPAEIQGYLLSHKHSPQGAVDGVEEWMKTIKREDSKVKCGTSTKRSEDEEADDSKYTETSDEA